MGRILHIGGGEIKDAVPKTRTTSSGKRALVLGGGGIAGGSFEIGALLALNDVLSGFKATDFDVYVGTSAGAFLSACLVNGITPEDLARSQVGHAPRTVPRIRSDEILRPVRKRLLHSAAAWAGGIKGTARQVARSKHNTSLVDLFFSMADDFKSSLYSTLGMDEYLHRLFAFEGRTNSFEDLEKDLLITATDLDTAERVVFGPSGNDPPISLAVAASAAIPIIYEPVSIHGREYLDGGLRSATNIDLAVSSGADFIVVINPLIPYLHDPRYLLKGFDSKVRHLSEGGLGRLVAQVFRIMARSQLEKELELLRIAHPDVDVLVIEPRRDDEDLFTFNLMDYSAKESFAKDGFEQVAVDLVTHFPEVRKLFSSTGISVSKKELVRQLQRVIAGGTAMALVEGTGELA